MEKSKEEIYKEKLMKMRKWFRDNPDAHTYNKNKVVMELTECVKNET